jgi:hypothetical protein
MKIQAHAKVSLGSIVGMAVVRGLAAGILKSRRCVAAVYAAAGCVRVDLAPNRLIFAK